MVILKLDKFHTKKWNRFLNIFHWRLLPELWKIVIKVSLSLKRKIFSIHLIYIVEIHIVASDGNLMCTGLITAAAAKSLQLCLTLCDPIDVSPPGSPILGILQARTLEWVAISFSNAWKWKVKVKLLSRVQLLETPRTAAYQAPPSMGFSRQQYWSGVPLPSPWLLQLMLNVFLAPLCCQDIVNAENCVLSLCIGDLLNDFLRFWDTVHHFFYLFFFN